MEPDTKTKVEAVKLYSVTSTPEGCDETLAPIIFIPGFFSTNRTFTPVRCKISKRTKRKAFAIELRNHGYSEYSDDFTLDHWMADLENFMETNNISKAVLAGHSMGGRLALAMALKHPEMVEKVIVEDVSVVTSKTAMEEYLKSMMFIKFLYHKLKQLPSDMSESEVQRTLLPHVEKFWPTLFKNFPKGKSQFRLPLHTTSSGELAWEFNADVILGVLNKFHVFDIDLSSNPVYNGDALLLVGEKSLTGVQNELEEMYKYFPNLRHEIIPRGFHTYHVESPELYVKLVSTFIGENKEKS